MRTIFSFPTICPIVVPFRDEMRKGQEELKEHVDA